jgi:uncharacterized protein
METGSSREGALVTVRVRPRSRPGIAVDEAGLLIRVAAPAVEGRATEAARTALADALRVAPNRVVLRRGERSRTKVFLVRDMNAEEVASRLSKVFLG